MQHCCRKYTFPLPFFCKAQQPGTAAAVNHEAGPLNVGQGTAQGEEQLSGVNGVDEYTLLTGHALNFLADGGIHRPKGPGRGGRHELVGCRFGRGFFKFSLPPQLLHPNHLAKGGFSARDHHDAKLRIPAQTTGHEQGSGSDEAGATVHPHFLIVTAAYPVGEAEGQRHSAGEGRAARTAFRQQKPIARRIVQDRFGDLFDLRPVLARDPGDVGVGQQEAGEKGIAFAGIVVAIEQEGMHLEAALPGGLKGGNHVIAVGTTYDADALHAGFLPVRDKRSEFPAFGARHAEAAFVFSEYLHG